MKTRRIIKKQLNTLPARFILGCIGPTNELFPEMSKDLIEAIQERAGSIEEVMPVQDFPSPPKAYFKEMRRQPLSTTMVILEDGGAYTDLHHLKRDILKIEGQLVNPRGERLVNINPGAVGTYGIILSSHKPTGDRPDISTYAFGSHPHTFPWPRESYYERIMRWTGTELELVDRALIDGAFPEYHPTDRVERFNHLVMSLSGNHRPIELLADIYSRAQTD